MWRGGLQSSELNLFTWNAITRAVAKGGIGGGGGGGWLTPNFFRINIFGKCGVERGPLKIFLHLLGGHDEIINESMQNHQPPLLIKNERSLTI